MDDKTARQRDFFANRILKRFKHLKKWAKREDIDCFRIYNKDIPEVPLSVDWYSGYLHIFLYERPYEKSDAEESEWLETMKSAAAESLGIPHAKVFTKMRKRQRGDDQYEKIGERKFEIEIREGPCRFLVNLSDYLDSGLFLDHRITRTMIREQSKNARFLNLFCYTGSFSVHALSGGAESAVSVDLSNTYLDWARRNCALNGYPEGPSCRFVRNDARAFLRGEAKAGSKYDIIVLDPPTFSNSKMARDDFDVNRDWPQIVRESCAVLASGGTLYFSTNSRRFKMDPALADFAAIEDITEKTIPPDFKNTKIHQCFRIYLAEIQFPVEGS